MIKVIKEGIAQGDKSLVLTAIAFLNTVIQTCVRTGVITKTILTMPQNQCI